MGLCQSNKKIIIIDLEENTPVNWFDIEFPDSSSASSPTIWELLNEQEKKYIREYNDQV